MRKILVVVLLFFASISYGNTGWYNDFISIDLNNTGSSSYWIGGDPGSGTQLQGSNFGNVNSLSITSVDMKYWSDTQDRTGGSFFYQITNSDGSLVVIGPTEVIWTHNSLGGNDYQGIWSGSLNLLSSLDPNTTYQLQIWAKSWGTDQGDSWLSNGGANYVATFTTSKTITWTGDSGEDWAAAGNWSDGVPTSIDNVVIPSSLTNYPTITAATTIENITIQDGATLLDNGNLTINGTFTVQRSISNNNGWHTVSSPVSTMTIVGSDFVPNASGDPLVLATNFDFYSFDQSDAATPWINIRAADASINSSFETSFTLGKGYLVAYAADYGNTTFDFQGILNTGTISAPTLAYSVGNDYAGWNMLGNPYPSAIDWGGASKTAFADDFVYVYNENKAGGAGYEEVDGGSSGAIIAPNQGFFVKVTESGSFDFTESIRTHGGSFMKSMENEDKIILRISNSINYNETSIRVKSNSEDVRDRNDALKLFSLNAAIPQVFSLTADLVNVSINSIPEITTDESIQLGLYLPETTEYILSLESILGQFEGNYVYLTDRKLGTEIDLANQGSYTFIGDPSDKDRFEIHFGVVGINDQPTTPAIQAYVYGQQLKVLGNGGITQLEIFDVQGRLLSRETINVEDGYSKTLNLKAGMYVVRLQNKEGVSSTKVIIK